MRLIVTFFLLICLSLSTAHAASLPEFTKLVEKSSPAVVNISTTRKVGGSYHNFDGSDLEQIPEFFRHFFRDRAPRRGQREAQSTGSGFIVSEDGYILTNNHVVEGADDIFIRLADRRELQAELIGADARSDLAVLKVKADDLPTLKMGKSENLKVGEWVLAIGSPFGFDHSVTAGIVSAKGRSLPNGTYVPFIQTDVAINPGNSGGPLFNLDGEVVGINSQIITRSGGYMGLSFAIPIDVAMNVVEQLKSHGAVKRGWLGVLIQEVDKNLAESFSLDKPMGALVAQVMEDSPAEKAGVKSGDVIVEFEGAEIDTSAELPHLVGQVKPGTKSKLGVVRAGKEIELTVVIGELPGEEQVAERQTGKTTGSGGVLNIQVRNLTEEERESKQLSGGVLVTAVKEGPAAEAGIRANDIISNINSKTVNSVSELTDILEDIPTGKSVPVLIIRNGRHTFISLKLSK